MRDPRSIAQSLRGMRWGPNDLNDCCAWVSGYCAAWLDAQKMAASMGIEIACFSIEDIANNPDECADGLCRAAGIDLQSDLFRGASTSILNGWVNSATDTDRALLDRRLSGWVHHFGYRPEQIGHRKSVGTGEVARFGFTSDNTPGDSAVAAVF